MSHDEALRRIIDKLQVWADECALAPDFPAYEGEDWAWHFARRRETYLDAIEILETLLYQDGPKD